MPMKLLCTQYNKCLEVCENDVAVRKARGFMKFHSINFAIFIRTIQLIRIFEIYERSSGYYSEFYDFFFK